MTLRPPKVQKQKAIYPYGPATGSGGEVANSKGKGIKLGKNLSREVNKGKGKDASCCPTPSTSTYGGIANRKKK